MKNIELSIVAITGSSLEVLSGEEVRSVESRLVKAAQHLEVVVLDEAPEPFSRWSFTGSKNPGEALKTVQELHSFGADETLVIGSDVADLDLADHCVLYFHVGPENLLGGSRRHVVPLWGQYGVGIINVLDYFDERGFRDRAIDHQDVVDFVSRSIRFYESSDAVTKAHSAHTAFCQQLRSAIGENIAGVFGTGFPFYCLEPIPNDSAAGTPNSILRYLREQEAYFSAKLIDGDTFSRYETSMFESSSARAELGLSLERNSFDLYEYESAGVEPPQSPSFGTLRELLEGTAIDVCEDPWPCLYCVTLQAPDLYPHQNVEKDTNETCLRCRQTPLMLRNVTGSSIDIDAVVVVHEDAVSAAEQIRSFVLGSDGHYLYDLDLRRMVWNEMDGPLDLFVTTVEEITASFETLSTSRWLEADFSAVALWSLTRQDHKFNLGEDFPVGFEPQTPLDSCLERGLRTARKRFSEMHSAETVVEQLRAHSSARRQLLSDESVVEVLQNRLRSWREDNSVVL